MAGSLNRDGRKYADRSKSSIISFLLDEDSNNYRRQLEAKGIKPKNHHKQNLKQIKQIQKSVKQQQENKMKQANIRHKTPAKYTKIDSKLKQTLSSSASTVIQHNNNTNFIKKNMSKVQSRSSLNALSINKTRINTQRKPAIPTRAGLNISKNPQKEQKDFVSMNKERAQRMTHKPKEKRDVRFVEKKDYGKVPEYIIQRKIEREELEQKKMEEEEARKIPDGMRKMTDDERLETLQILETNKQKIIESIKNLPLVIETPSMIKYQRELNGNLKQIEKTIMIFQKPTVFVAMDE